MYSGNFGGFDWGSDEENIQQHGSSSPPNYRLEDVTTKVSHHVTKYVNC